VRFPGALPPAIVSIPRGDSLALYRSPAGIPWHYIDPLRGSKMGIAESGWPRSVIFGPWVLLAVVELQ
jgi:hypothetical protein